VARAYQKILQSLAEGSREEARDGAYDLETKVFASVGDEPHLLLAGGEMTIINRLAEHEVESLVPLMILHLELQKRYVEERRYPIASHTDSLVTALAEIYAEQSQSDLGPSLAADVLASVGAYLQSAQLRVPARRMLERALSLDERSSFALLQLAVAHEARGEYAEAVTYLRRLLQIDPQSEEGRLRLALNLRRLGDVGEAGRLLDRLVWGRSSEAVCVVAYQERARIEVDGERPERAAGLLREAIGRYPQQLRLHIQLAYALDRAGDSKAAGRVAQGLDSRATTSGSSPRYHYGRNSIGGRSEGGDAALDDAATTRLPALAAALDRMPGGKP
jgi:tetratricopeptide (TPR) repeat protein